MPDRGMEVYGPMWSAALAKWQGVLQTGLEDPPKGGGYNGEFGLALNCQYSTFSCSVSVLELICFQRTTMSTLHCVSKLCRLSPDP
jgi:hypothetical protein